MEWRESGETRNGGKSFPGGKGGTGEPGQTPNCHLCVNYYVTWDPSMPYGCKAFGFKSKVNPALEVYRSSGSNCMAFQPKKDGAFR